MFAAGCDPPGAACKISNNFTAPKAALFFRQPMRTRSPGNPNGTKTRAAVIQASHGLAAICQGGQSEFVKWFSHEQMTMRNP